MIHQIKTQISIKNILAGLLLSLFVIQCTPAKSYMILSKDIQANCYPHASYKIGNLTHRKISVVMSHYKDCQEYKDVLVVRWDKYNSTEVRSFVHRTMRQYVAGVHMHPTLVQWEQWGDGFYIVYELDKD